MRTWKNWYNHEVTRKGQQMLRPNSCFPNSRATILIVSAATYCRYLTEYCMTVTAYQHQDVSNRHQFEWLLHRLARCTTKQNTNSTYCFTFVGGTNQWPVDPSQWCGKSCHSITYSWLASPNLLTTEPWHDRMHLLNTIFLLSDITVAPWVCHSDIHRCRRWWQGWRRGDSRFSVLFYLFIFPQLLFITVIIITNRYHHCNLFGEVKW